MSKLRALLIPISFTLAASACSLRVSQDSSDLTDARGELPEASPIVNGAPATNYPEAVLINSKTAAGGFSCSGSMIAPRVVLTAGHCVLDVTSATVVAP